MKTKVLKVIIVLIVFVMAFTNVAVFATSVKDAFSGDTSNVGGAVTATQKVVGMILDIIRTIGMGIALIMLTYIGIKFMLASPSERANIKQYSINFVVGAFILIGGTGILTIIKNFAVGI